MPSTVVDQVAGRLVDQRRMREILTALNPGKTRRSRGTWQALVTAFIRHADWATGAITVPHETIAAEAGEACGRGRPFSHDTVGRFVKAAIAAGVLICPAGLGGMSRRAFGGRRNQCPTYFVTDPTSTDADLRTPPSHDSETVALRDDHSLYKGPKFSELSKFDASVVPATASECRTAAEWLRARLLVGVIPNWRFAAMLSKHFTAGRAPAQLLKWACQSPDGVAHRPLPVGDATRTDALDRSPHQDTARMLMGMIGARLRQWADIPPPAAATAHRSAALPTVGPRTSPRSASTLAELARVGLRAGALRAGA